MRTRDPKFSHDWFSSYLEHFSTLLLHLVFLVFFYKGYGCNNAKPPRLPHHNTMIDVFVLRCGPILMGEGAAAPFNGVHILGEIWPAGGVDTLAKSQWEDLS